MEKSQVRDKSVLVRLLFRFVGKDDPARNIEQERNQAELYFAKAIMCHRSEIHRPVAKLVAKACIDLLDNLPSKTQEDCSTRSVRIDDVLLPDFLDSEIAKRKFIQEGIDIS